MRLLLALLALTVPVAALAGCASDPTASNFGTPFSLGGQYTAHTDSETHTWSNLRERAHVSWGGQAETGSVRVTITDAAGREVYQHTFTSSNGGAVTTTSSGTPGEWTVRLTFTAFTGQLGITATGA